MRCLDSIGQREFVVDGVDGAVMMTCWACKLDFCWRSCGALLSGQSCFARVHPCDVPNVRVRRAAARKKVVVNACTKTNCMRLKDKCGAML